MPCMPLDTWLQALCMDAQGIYSGDIATYWEVAGVASAACLEALSVLLASMGRHRRISARSEHSDTHLEAPPLRFWRPRRHHGCVLAISPQFPLFTPFWPPITPRL